MECSNSLLHFLKQLCRKSVANGLILMKISLKAMKYWDISFLVLTE